MMRGDRNMQRYWRVFLELTYRVGPELDNGSMVEGVDFPGQGQLSGPNMHLHVVFCLHVVMGPGLFKNILHKSCTPSTQSLLGLDVTFDYIRKL